MTTNIPRPLSTEKPPERLVEGIQALLLSRPLLTLTGTDARSRLHLAVGAAGALEDHYPDGVWLVQLAPLSDPDLLPHTIAAALNLEARSSQPSTQKLVDHLNTKTLLLILDQCEHLQPACAELVETLLGRCPNLTLLATSRSALGVVQESVLHFPDGGRSHPRSAAMSEIEVNVLSAAPKTREMLSEILMEVVANGGSVSFMHPLERETAGAFWDGALAAAARGERVVLGAWDGGVLAGTVTLLLDCPPNQPHRAEIAKLMTRLSHRGRGVAAALMRAAEDVAVQRGRTLLVLDTATDGGAAGLYEGLGFTLAGEIPNYALKPHGGLTGTLIYWKRIGPGADMSPDRTGRFGTGGAGAVGSWKTEKA